MVPGAGLGPAKVDPGQFEQAIINMAVNARDAMPNGGRITIETRNTVLDAEYAESHPEVKPGRYVSVAVSDSGHGMDEATRARIFEPFFTTKGPGKGTGLGLAMVYGFVKQSGGHVAVDSEPALGSIFTVYLPCADEAIATTRPTREAPRVVAGRETILIVEDEDLVRKLVRRILMANGYAVLEARDGQDALLVAEQHGGRIHLVVSDGGIAFLHKPFTPAALAQKVREVLDTAG